MQMSELSAGTNTNDRKQQKTKRMEGSEGTRYDGDKYSDEEDHLRSKKSQKPI